MITIEDIVSLPVFDSVWLAAPCEGYLKRPVWNGATLDYEPFTGDYDLFKPGEFVFTSMGFAVQQPDLVDEALLALIERDVAAVAIKAVVLDKISDEVAQASADAGVPILFYHGRYAERIIAETMNLIDRDAARSQNLALIDSLVAPSDEQKVREAMFELAQISGATCQCVAVTPVRRDPAALLALGDTLREVLADYSLMWTDVERVQVIRYRDVLLGLISYKRPPLSIVANSDPDLQRRMAEVAPLRCGISLEVELGEGDLALRQALAALSCACEREETCVRWAAMGIDAFGDAARADRLFATASLLQRTLLAEYDKKHDASLAATAEAYARAGGEVRAAAEALYQHPNTVRYRLKKIKEVLGMDDADDKALAQLLMLTYLE